MMYFFWKTKGMLPSVFYNLPKNEKLILRAFYETEVSERKQAIDVLVSKGVTVPFY